VLVTIDTMRADHVGAYGYTAARTPSLDRLANEGTRFDRAFATAPITLTSHASLLTGRYPPGHGARDNGTPMRGNVPTLGTVLHDRGFATAAFVAAFPLDRRFGLTRGFDVYSDRMPRSSDGRLQNERPGRQVVDEAIAWMNGRDARFFVWVHLFEPHAPYGDPVRDAGRPAVARYDDEIATADRETGRLIDALGSRLRDTLVVVASDHGEAFGEHGEIGHSLFVYDTTLRVALLFRGPGVPAGRTAAAPVSLVDVVPTVMGLLGLSRLDADGIDLRPVIDGAPGPARELYAESFAPLVDFGWSPLRTVRQGRWKAIAAPRPELFDVERDPDERDDLAVQSTDATKAALAGLLSRADRYSGSDLPAADRPAAGGSGQSTDDARSRLSALGYVQGGRATVRGRPDPKDRRGLAARIAQVTSGEITGDALVVSLRSILREDPGNGQMHLRLGDALIGRGSIPEAEAQFAAALSAEVPGADPYIGLAFCQAKHGALDAALRTLRTADRIDPANPVVLANIGVLEARRGQQRTAAAALRQALELDPDLHEARFNLALALARAGQRAGAAHEAQELLRRLPLGAPQRPEVERLLAALR
jgi:arylsulfatase A-like enzyme/Flp pilus assembly protein TadD